MTKIVILTGKSGDLCNRMFRFARFYCSKPKEVLLVDLTFYQFAYLFSPRSPLWRILFWMLRLLNNRRFTVVANFLKKLPGVVRIDLENPGPEGENADLSQFYSDILNSPHRMTLVENHTFYMRSSEGTMKTLAKLRRIFSLKSRYRKAARNLLAEIDKRHEVVGVHLRRRDYRTFAEGKFFFENSEYNRHLQKLASQMSPGHPPEFVLICEEPLDIGEFQPSRVHCFGPSCVGTDQALLASCDLIVGPPSTFNAWPGFLHGIPRAVICGNAKSLGREDFSSTSVNYTPI